MPLDHDQYPLLRSRLDQLNYKHYFSPDSFHLVQQLLNDLLQTTDTVRKLKTSQDLLTAEKQTAEKLLIPLRQEISHLTAENNQLHIDLIRQADQRDEREKDVQLVVRKYENELSDLRFINSQYRHKINVEQRKVEQEKLRIEDWMRQQGVLAAMNTGKASAKVNAVKTEKMFRKLQRIEMETGLEPMNPPHDNIPRPDPQVADVVQISQARIDTLEKHCKEVELTNADLQAQIQTVRQHAASRDQEIERLGVQLEQARSSITTFLPSNDPAFRQSASPTRNPQQRVEQLEIQLEYLQEHISSLEAQSTRIENEKSVMGESWEREKKKLETELEFAKEKNEGLKKNLQKLESLVEELGKLKKEGKITTHATRTASRSPNKENAKKSLPPHGHRIGKSPVNKKEVPPRPLGTPTKNSKELEDTAIEAKSLRSALTEATTEIEQLRSDVLRLTEAFIETGVPDKSKMRTTELTGENSKDIERREKELDTIKQKNADLEQALSSLESQKVSLDGETKSLQRKCDHLEQLLAESKSQSSKLQGVRQESSEKHIELQGVMRRAEDAERRQQNGAEKLKATEDELDAVVRERNDLIVVLEKFENQFSDVENDIRVITAERDNIRQLYEQVHRELQIARNATFQPESESGNLRRSPSSDIRKIEEERESLKLDIHRLKDELEDTLNKLRSLQEEHEKYVATMDLTLKDVRAERDTAQAKVTEVSYDVNVAREKANHFERNLAIANQENRDKQERNDQLRAFVERMNHEQELQREDMVGKTSALDTATQKVQDLEAELSSLRREHVQQGDALKEQRILLRDLDSERDTLHADVDAKTEKLLEMQDHIQNLREQIRQLDNELAAARDQVDALTHHLNEQDREIASLRRQLDQTTGERDSISSECQRHAEESRNLNTDLMAMTKENQILNSELSEVAGERERLVADLQGKTGQVQYFEELLMSKEQEREQVMASYRKLINEHERLDHTWKATADDTNNMRMEIALRDKKIQLLQKTVDEQSNTARQYKMDFQAYEKQANHLTRTLATVERELRQAEDMKQRLTREVTAARDLSASLDRSKEELHKQISMAAVENEQLRSAIKGAESEKETVQSQLRAERKKCENLEHVIAIERTEKFHSTMKEKELQVTKGSLEEKLQALNAQQQHSISSLTAKLNNAEEECTRLKARLDQTEDRSREKQSELARNEEEKRRLTSIIQDLREQAQVSERIVERLKADQKHNHALDKELSNKTPVEPRIFDELDASKQLQPLNAQQQHSISSLKAKLNNAEEECTRLKARLDQTEDRLREKQSELARNEEEKWRLNSIIQDLREQAQVSERIVERLKADQKHALDDGPFNKTASEQRIFDELDATKQLQALNTQQQHSNSSLTEECTRLKARLDQTEDRLREKQSELARNEEEKRRLSSIVQDLREQAQVSERIIERLKAQQKHNQALDEELFNKTALEQRIFDELDATKQQLKKYEAQIQSSKRDAQTSVSSPQYSNSTQSSEENLAEELLVTWQAQNDAMRRELLAFKSPPISNTYRGNGRSTPARDAQTTPTFTNRDAARVKRDGSDRHLMDAIVDARKSLNRTATPPFKKGIAVSPDY